MLNLKNRRARFSAEADKRQIGDKPLMKNSLHHKTEFTLGVVAVCDFYEVGNWTTYYPQIKLGYKIDGYDIKYSDVAIYVKEAFCKEKVRKKENVGFCGYCLARAVVNVDTEDIIPLYGKKLVLYDFAVLTKSYAKCAAKLLDYLCDYAKNKGFNAIEVKKDDNYAYFFDFLSKRYKLKEKCESYYIVIAEPRKLSREKHLVIYDNQNVELDDLYFLCDIGFSVLKTSIKGNLSDDNVITVDRKSGIIKFPPNVKILNDEVVLNTRTRDILYLICKILPHKQTSVISIDYSTSAPNDYEVYFGEDLYVSKAARTLFNDSDYALSMTDKGIKKMFPLKVDYNMNDRGFYCNLGGMTCDDIIKKCRLNNKRHFSA